MRVYLRAAGAFWVWNRLEGNGQVVIDALQRSSIDTDRSGQKAGGGAQRDRDRDLIIGRAEAVSENLAEPKATLVRLNLFAEGARTELRGIMVKRPPLTPRGNGLAALWASRGQRDLGTRRGCGNQGARAQAAAR